MTGELTKGTSAGVRRVVGGVPVLCIRKSPIPNDRTAPPANRNRDLEEELTFCPIDFPSVVTCGMIGMAFVASGSVAMWGLERTTGPLPLCFDSSFAISSAVSVIDGRCVLSLVSSRWMSAETD